MENQKGSYIFDLTRVAGYVGLSRSKDKYRTEDHGEEA